MPHLFIPGVMECPQRFHTSHTLRHAAKFAVACNAVGRMFVKETTGTTYKEFKAQRTYFINSKKGPKEASSMVGEEYMGFIRDAVAHYKVQPGFRRYRAGALIVHDKSRVHTSHVVMNGLLNMGMEAKVQPARSPDTMPLDYGVFGTAKMKLEREVDRNSSWETKVLKFKEILQRLQPARTIQEYPLRLQAVINSDGFHIDNALNALKKVRSER